MESKDVLKSFQEFKQKQEDGYSDALEFGSKRDLDFEKDLDLFGAVLDLIKKQQAEIDDLFLTLKGVMLSVDKWLNDDELKQDEVNRAITMREKTLQIIENQQAEIERLQGGIDDLDCKLSMANDCIAETNKQRGAVIHAITRIDEVKTEAYKEFADRLKKEFSQCQREYRNVLNSDGACAMIIAKKVVDNILTELTERKEDEGNA